jgi:hypothetical protein
MFSKRFTISTLKYMVHIFSEDHLILENHVFAASYYWVLNYVCAVFLPDFIMWMNKRPEMNTFFGWLSFCELLLFLTLLCEYVFCFSIMLCYTDIFLINSKSDTRINIQIIQFGHSGHRFLVFAWSECSNLLHLKMLALICN